MALIILAGCQASGGGGGGGGGIVTTNPSYTTTISGTTNKIANNVDVSTITITVMDGVTPVVGNVPTFTVSGSNNFIFPCSATDATGTSTCTLKSTKAEIKTIKAATPNVSATSTVTFIAGPVATASTISSAGPVIADGTALMTINVSMKDAFGNVVSGSTPVFDATPGTTNVYGSCTSSNASGASTCSMKSSVAGIKTLRITSPVAVTGGPAFFFAGPAVAANTTIVGTTPHTADGVDASTITITMKDATMNPIMGTVPTFSASGTGNSLGACSSSDFTGTSTCTLKSTVGGVKALALVTPIAKAGNSVTFNASVGAPVAANSSITGTSPVVADGVATSTVTITLKDASNTAVPGIVPTFAATDTNSSNNYGTCSATNASGISTCTLASTGAETKTLMITAPVIKAGGTVVFVPGAPSSVTSTITGSSPVVADGTATSTISIYIKDAYDNGIAGSTPTFSATDTGMQNVYGACSPSSATGLSTCTLASTIAEVKTLQLLTPVVVVGGTVTFTAGAAVAANSNITGTSPVIADGSDSSTVTITLRDISNNPVAGQTPTFSATDTGTDNAYGACSVSNASGVSTCTLKSTTAETKTLSIATPVVKADGTVVFNPAGASVANSSITGTSPVLADGSATSTITITLKDANNNPVSGTVPTFGATDTGTTNTYGTCSATNASGISSCTLASTRAEVKSLSIATPVVKTGGSVTFTPDIPLAANSTITGTSPVVADGTATSTVSVTLRDANNNPVPGQTPTFSATDTGSSNVYGSCSSSNAGGVSTCTLSSTNAETKTLSIVTPVAKADGSVVFTAGAAVAANSTITGTSTIVADGVATSTVTITLNDVNNNPVSGQTPTFSATDSGSTNTYGACSVSDASGVSTCTLSSLAAETKTLSIATPVVKADGTVVFIPGGASVANSSITGSSPVVADGSATSTVTITLKDANNNSVIGTVPTFSATDSGTTNSYGVCSATDASGVSTCSLASLKAEVKTLSIATPVVKAGGTVTFNPDVPVAANSSISGSSPVVADGTATSTVSVTLKDANNNPVPGLTPTFSATDTGSTNNYGACSATDATGVATCSLSSLSAEIKTLSLATPVVKVGGTVTFTAGAPVAANSSISGTSPVVADGSSTSTITITLNDINNNPVAGQTPTFSATDTSSTNNYGTCSASNASGISTCTLDSTYAEVKTLSIATPVVKTGGTVTFTAGSAVAANSSISGTSSVVADGSATSTVTITLKDAANNPVTGQTPTFSATDTSSGNTYGPCSATDASGVSTCSLSSTVAEVKTLSIATPVIKAGGTVTFTAGAPVAANSSISGTSPVLADGTATSTVSITLKDVNNNAVSGQTPTFSATDTSSGNSYGACTASDASGVSTCSLSSTVAEIKTLSIATPVVKTGGTVTFSAGSAVAANSTISGTSPVVADGSATSTVTITLKDASNNAVSGVTPTFTATDTSSGNTYGSCSSSNASGVSTCTLKSTIAEVKTLSIATPVVKAGGTVTFTAGAAVAANSTITGTSPVVADGSATSTITITLKDVSNNPVSGQTPTFSATDTGSVNVYGACSSSDASGVSTCTLKSTKAEIKTLSIATPVVKAGGTVTFNAGSVVAANSTITGTSPVLADGTSTSTVTVTLMDAYSNPVSGSTPTFSASGTGNTYNTCSATNASGVSTCTMTSSVAEVKTLSIQTPVVKAGGTVTFTAGSAVAANSTITGTSPVVADGLATSTVTITLKDASNNAVSGVVPTFSATNTSTTNVYGTCSSSNASGVSTCTLASSVAEVKTLSIATPVVKAGGTVTFTAGAAVAANSTITGTSPVVADGSATSTVTITLKDAGNNAVSGQVPTFGATDTGSGNVYGTCSSSNASGVSTCTLKSTKAEVKTLSIATPVVKAGGTVTFTAGAAVAANSTITGTSPVVADNTATSTVTITLLDANNNPVSGSTPTFTTSGTGNTQTACSASNASGISTCTVKSTVAEVKTLAIATPVVKTGGTVTFTAGSAVAANSTISGTGPVVANGTATSTVTIVLKDASNNAVSGIVPTFGATDTGSGNVYGTCSSTDATGTSTCTLKSTKAEVKTLSIATPVVKAGSTVTFTAGAAVVANSTITGTGSVVADGVASSTVTITLKDANNNGVSGTVPTFTATNTGTTNVYGTCSSSDATGASTCTLKSTKAQVKTLSIATPVVKAGGTVTFIAGSASATTSQITGTSPVSADGVSTSFIAITVLDAYSNPITGVTPIFNATNTNTANVYGACSATDTSGQSACTLASTKAEAKTLQLTSPVAVTGDVITFSSSLPTSANSTITGTSPVAADGNTDSTITITLKDSNNNAVPGITPTFDATDTGATNTYDDCSMSDAGGVSVCTMQSTVAEVKTLRITTPVTKTGGTVTFTAGVAAAATSTITGTSPVIADGTATSTVTITIKDAFNNAISGTTPTFTATNTGSGNTYGSCSATNASGVSTCTLKSTKAEVKTLSIATPVIKAGGTVTFNAGSAVAVNSTITGTGPTNPDGTSQSTITITLKDANSNLVAGVTPTFSASGTNNTYNACSATNASGVSTCTMTSTTAETKTLSIATPVVKAGGTVVFASGSPSVANSSISGTSTVVANGVATSTVTITLKDNTNAAVVNVTPTFTATGTSNTYNSCSITNVSGVSTCTMTSTVAEVKTLSIASPIVKAGSTVTFIPGAASASTSTIECDNDRYLADGSDTCNITVAITDAFNNAISGTTPTISVSGTSNTVSSCSVTDASGQSTCTLKSTKAEGKFLSIVTPVAVSNPIEYEFNPGGINIQVPIEMLDRGLTSTTSAVTFARSRTTLDTNEYDAAANDYFFEISAANTNTSTAYTVQLVNTAGTVIPDANITVPANTTLTTRLRVNFTPTDGADTYRIKIPATSTASQLKVHSARIIVVQTNAIKTKIYIPLVGSDYAGESSSDTGATVATTTSTTYNVSSAVYYQYFTRNDANFDAVPATNGWTLDVNLRASNAAGIAYATLYDKANNQQITEATTSSTGTTITQKTVTFNSNATNFNDGDNLELRIKSSSTSYTAQVFKAGLWVKLKYLKKADIWWRLATRRSTTSTLVLPDARFLYESAYWSNPTASFVTWGNTATTAIQLYSTTTSDSANTGSSASSITQPASYGRSSAAVTLVDNYRYIINHQRTSGTATMGAAYVIINAHD